GVGVLFSYPPFRCGPTMGGVAFWQLGFFLAAFFAPVAVGVRNSGRSEGGFCACSGLFAETCMFFCFDGWCGVLDLAMGQCCGGGWRCCGGGVGVYGGDRWRLVLAPSIFG
ncbi:hypothetical protein L195_g025917, partial [Trifolium pratense]